MKKIILVITIGLFTISAFSQKQQNRHEFSIWGGGGISSLQYNLNLKKTDEGKHKLGYGYIGGLGYNYFFNYNWSLGIGAEFSSLTAATELPLFTDAYWAPGKEWRLEGQGQEGPIMGSDIFRIKTRTVGQDYKEKQQAYYINVPVMAKYQIDVWKEHKFYASAGAKFGFPTNAFYQLDGQLYMTGYIKDVQEGGTEFGVNDPVSMKKYGFGLFDDLSGGKLPFKFNLMAALESGMKWKLNQGWSLYTGVYFDYGLIDIRKSAEKGKLFHEYNRENPIDYTANSVLFAVHNDESIAFADKVNTMALGLKVQLTYGIKPFDKKEKVKPVVEEKPYEGLTASQMEDIMSRNTNKLIDAQQKEFEALKALIIKEDPDFADAIYGFEFDKSNILNVMHPDLNRKVELLKKYPEAKVTLEGHTDDAGSDAYNYKLGLARANSVRNYFAARGINPNRFEITSKGRSNPLIPNADEASRVYNRRVEFILRK